MIRIIENTKDKVIFEKETRGETWFDNDCSNENLKKQCNRIDDTISRVQWKDGKYIASELIVYFKNDENSNKSVPLRYDADMFTPPFRVGRKHKRAILDANGLEVIIMPHNSEKQAQMYCDYLNGSQQN
jgi:hypothetical protein